MGNMMIRKQIYLPKRQNQLIKRLAKQRGISEAEVIRQALEREAGAIPYPVHEGENGWEGILQFVKERKAVYAGQGKPVKWNRQELYEEPGMGK